MFFKWFLHKKSYMSLRQVFTDRGSFIWEGFFIWFFKSHQQSFSYKGTGLPGLNQYSARINVLAQGHNTVTPVRLEPATPWSWVKHSATALPNYMRKKLIKYAYFSTAVSNVNSFGSFCLYSGSMLSRHQSMWIYEEKLSLCTESSRA